MSKQLAVSAVFSIFTMAAYVLFGADAARESLDRAATAASPVEVSAPELPERSNLLPFLR